MNARRRMLLLLLLVFSLVWMTVRSSELQAMFVGSHTWLNGTVIDCRKCHRNIMEDINLSLQDPRLVLEADAYPHAYPNQTGCWACHWFSGHNITRYNCTGCHNSSSTTPIKPEWWGWIDYPKGYLKLNNSIHGPFLRANPHDSCLACHTPIRVRAEIIKEGT